jgi:Ca2+-binding RTX toxin-like protein
MAVWPLRKLVVLLTVPALAGFMTLPASAVAGLGETKIEASDGRDDDRFGNAIAVDGDTIVVGARSDDHSGLVGVGAAYVYEPDGTGSYTETKLTASNPAASQLFGSSVAVSDGTIVVGATGTINNVGSAHVFEPDGLGGYTETKLTPSSSSGVSFFGVAVAIAGDIVAVGDYSDQTGPGAGGSVRLYTPNGAGGYDESKLTASDAAVGDFFGTSVAASGDVIVVGATGDGNSRGAAYVYAPNGTGGYTETKLRASDAAADDRFGVSVAIDGDNIVVGAEGDDDGGRASGSAYVYSPDGNGGYTETKLTASDATETDFFGESVAISGDTVIVGAYQDSDIASGAGSAYAFTADGLGGYDETKLTASDGAAFDQFGSAVAIDGELIAIGAEDLSDPGAAYLYQSLRCDGQVVTVDLGAGDSPTAGNDVILGTSGDDVIAALGGDDVVCGLGGDDVIIGGPGDDTVLGGAGDDTISGNGGDDVLRGDGGRDRVYGGSGTDLVDGGGGSDLALGGGSDADRVLGGLGNDVITGGGAADIEVSGGDGDDAVNGGSGNDTNVRGDAGNDTVSGNGGDDTVSGGDGNDQVRGGRGDDTVNGDNGDDFLAGNDGTDTCDGGPDTDTAAGSCEVILNVP